MRRCMARIFALLCLICPLHIVGEISSQSKCSVASTKACSPPDRKALRIIHRLSKRDAESPDTLAEKSSSSSTLDDVSEKSSGSSEGSTIEPRDSSSSNKKRIVQILSMVCPACIRKSSEDHTHLARRIHHDQDRCSYTEKVLNGTRECGMCNASGASVTYGLAQDTDIQQRCWGGFLCKNCSRPVKREVIPGAKLLTLKSRYFFDPQILVPRPH